MAGCAQVYLFAVWLEDDQQFERLAAGVGVAVWDGGVELGRFAGGEDVFPVTEGEPECAVMTSSQWSDSVEAWPSRGDATAMNVSDENASCADTIATTEAGFVGLRRQPYMAG